ncbi:MAG: sulfotransferase family 2 domain-containing protein [Marinicella sp.]
MTPAQRLKTQIKKKRRWLKRRLHTLPLWYQEPEFIFIHINKTGGSSVEKALNLPFEHLTALEKIDEVGEETWQQKFTFSFVRNPFDKVFSHYRYRVKTNQTNLKKNPLSFSDWVRLSYGEQVPYYYDNPRMFMPQCQWLCDQSGSIIVDKVYRFENLSTDFKALSEKFNLKVSLPHLKASKKVDYTPHYDLETRDIVEQRFKQDLLAFNYKF